MTERQRVPLLTGASRGIGHATVKTFSDAGWRILTISRHPFDPRCPWEGGAKNHIQVDLADIDQVLTGMPRLRDIVGDRLDALVNNAAISPKHADGSKIQALKWRMPTGCTSSTSTCSPAWHWCRDYVTRWRQPAGRW